MFIKNAWYVAGWASEIGRELTQRWIAGEPVVLYRTEAGTVAALEDRCPHRRASLSKGNLVGDHVQCAYHGITFDCSGTCVSIPGQDRVPSAMKVKQFAVAEKWQWIWIWMGDASQADESLLPQTFAHNDMDGWEVVGGTIEVKANYQLLVDNLLDLTHETYVHGKTIGNTAIIETPMEYEVKDDHVHVKRIMRNTTPPPLFQQICNFPGNIDRWQLIRFEAPGHVSIDARAYPMGEDNLENGLRWFSLNSLTPCDESSSIYYWTITRCFKQDDKALSDLIREKIIATFMEDVVVIEAQQKLIETDTRGIAEVSIRADGGSIAARRMVQRLCESSV